jgi:hypothetical protein
MSNATFQTPKKLVALVPPPAPHANKPIQRADGREVRKHTIYLATELSQKLTTYCAETGKGLGTVISEALHGYLSPEPHAAPVAEPAPVVSAAPAEAPRPVRAPHGLAQRLARPFFVAARRVLGELETLGW